MHCCGADSTPAGRFFSHFARFMRWRYERFGLEKTQRQLVAGIGHEGLTGTSILEIGCGVGFLHQSLLKHGAETAVGVDVSEKVLFEAHQLAASQGLLEKTHYRLGDFVELSPRLEPADIVILDKVVCCYPDAKLLVETSLDKTTAVIALTYPRKHLATRAYIALYNGFFWLIRTTFRNYIHDPEQIEAWIIERGFKKVFQDETLLWLTQVYAQPLEAA